MTRGLSSKVRAVLSLLPAFLLALNVAHAQQNILAKKVTVNFQGVRFSEALQEIEKQARVHFIYSSSIIEPGRKVTFSGTNTPLSEIFRRLGHEMNLEFKAQSLYVIIKKEVIIPSPPTLTLPAPALQTISEKQVVKAGEIQRTTSVVENTSVDLAAQIHRQYLRKLDSLNLGSTMLKINRQQDRAARQARLYAAAGLYLNDFSGGVELHAGLRSLYGVFTTGLSEEKYLRLGFGVGTNIRIAGKLRVSPVYTFASIKEISSQGISSISEDGYTVKAQQHQIKLMFEYPFAKNFYARLGPSFNVMKLNFKEQPASSLYYAGRSQSRSYSYGGPQNSSGNGFFSNNIHYTNSTSPEARYEAIKSWVGFEAGIYYTFNFSKGR